MEITNALQENVHPAGLLEQIHVDTLLDQRVSPGIVVLAPPLRLLHMNQQAWDLIQHIPHVRHGNGRSKRGISVLPRSLHQICAEIFAALRERSHAKDWEQSEIKRILNTSNQPILLRGFGVPDRSRRENSRVVLLLEAIGRRKKELNGETKQRFQLTEREQAVVQCLAKGWANKEIASALQLALPTVKEHVRHIMNKTNTTTRTGILMRILDR